MVEDPQAIALFLNMLAADQGAAKNTLVAYGRDLKLASRELGGHLAHAGAEELALLAASWRDLARTSVARKASALRRFFGFLAMEGMRTDDPSRHLPRPGGGVSLPRTISAQEAKRLCDAAEARFEAQPGFKSSRLVALVELLYGYPIDGVVLTTGCDKTTPAMLMGAATVDLPAITLNGGPMLDGHHQGLLTGSGTIVWKARKMLAQGEINYDNFMELVSSSATSVGGCAAKNASTCWRRNCRRSPPPTCCPRRRSPPSSSPASRPAPRPPSNCRWER